MSMRSKIGFLVLAAGAGMPAWTQAGDAVERLIDRIVANEQDFLRRMQQYRPILETYIQEMPEDGDPVADHYMLGRIDLSAGVSYSGYGSSDSFQKKRRWPFGRRSALVFSPEGFAQMVVMDLEEFDRRTYHFEYVRREFLGELRCLVLDVSPRDKKAVGKFIGRVWVDDRDIRIVRFNGTYTESKASSIFFHFDSWRVNVAPGFYVPAFVYVEDANDLLARGGRKLRIKAQTRLWGYHGIRNNKWDELTSILIEAENPVRDRSGSRDATPVESQRSWQRQAEENVIHRLEKSGLLAPPGPVDQVLNTVVNNLMATNNINLDVQCRVLLTTPLETFSIGHTIVISRGLLDVLPDEASLAMVLSDELAHIALGHRTETMFAFSDQTMFDEPETLRRLRMGRGKEEMEQASTKAVEILTKSPYKDKLANAGLFLKALESRAPHLPQLIQANLGNQLASGSNLLRLAELAARAPALDEEKVEQISALPLGSRIKLDPWTNQITMVKTKPVALLSAREKMPFEVTPVALFLTRVPAESQASTAEQGQDR